MKKNANSRMVWFDLISLCRNKNKTQESHYEIQNNNNTERKTKKKLVRCFQSHEHDTFTKVCLSSLSYRNCQTKIESAASI